MALFSPFPSLVHLPAHSPSKIYTVIIRPFIVVAVIHATLQCRDWGEWAILDCYFVSKCQFLSHLVPSELSGLKTDNMHKSMYSRVPLDMILLPSVCYCINSKNPTVIKDLHSMFAVADIIKPTSAWFYSSPPIIS